MSDSPSTAPSAEPANNGGTTGDPPALDVVEPSENFSAGALHVLPAPKRGRTAAETAQLWRAMKASEPRLTQVQAAERLGISRRTLRDALAATAEIPVSV